MRRQLRRLKIVLVPLRLIQLGTGAPVSLAGIALAVRTIVFLLRIGLGIRKPITVRFPWRGIYITLVLESSADLALIREVFLDEEYAHAPLRPGAVIFDVGANVGVASLYFHACNPDATIYAFEPDPTLFAKLQQRTADYPAIRPLPFALGGTDGSIEFFSAPDRPLSGSFIQRASQERPTLVTVKTLPTAARELGVAEIDLLKFDIEGAEFSLFTAAGDLSIHALVGEVHTDLMGVSEEEFLRALPAGLTARIVRRTAPGRFLLSGSLAADTQSVP